MLLNSPAGLTTRSTSVTVSFGATSKTVRRSTDVLSTRTILSGCSLLASSAASLAATAAGGADAATSALLLNVRAAGTSDFCACATIASGAGARTAAAAIGLVAATFDGTAGWLKTIGRTD
jgi:fructose-1,6-bisphosphatase/inositol monophosphatase family enzyme